VLLDITKQVQETPPALYVLQIQPDAAVRLPALVTRDMAVLIAVRHVLRVLLVRTSRRLQAMSHVPLVIQMGVMVLRRPLRALVTRGIPAATEV
jgi:hypothetical protein